MAFDASQFVAKAQGAGAFSFDVEHDPNTQFNHTDFSLWGVSFAIGEDRHWVRDRAVWEPAIHQLFALPDVDAVAYNGKYDLKCLRALGVNDDPQQLCDPMIGVNLLNENRKPNKLGLKHVVMDAYGYEMGDFMQECADGPDDHRFVKYTTDDAYYEYKLWRDIKPRLIDEGVYSLFSKILMPSSLFIADMELAGILWDDASADALQDAFEAMSGKLESGILSQIGDLNIGSGDQLATRLFDELGYSTRDIDLTKSEKRFSVDSKAMATLAKRYPVCQKIVHYRTALKMVGTYTKPLTQRAHDDPRHRIHPTFWLVSTTGRMRSENPNFQNIPAYLHTNEPFTGLNIRSCVIADPGRRLIVADLSQIELRLMAHISQDPLFLDAYLRWKCTCGSEGRAKAILHECPVCGAAENERVLSDLSATGFWHGIDIHTQTYEKISALHSRQDGKVANFELIYNATPSTMHNRHPGLNLRAWTKASEEYKALYKGVHAHHIRCEHQMDICPVTKNIFGRKRRIPPHEVQSNHKHALNQFINFNPQASACDFIQLAAVKIRMALKDSGSWMTRIWPSNIVHDELVFECEEAYIKEAIPIVQHHMEHAVQLRVPVRTDIVVCDNWGQVKG